MNVNELTYYNRPRTDLVDLAQNRNVATLEVGCGAGATAELLVTRGVASHVDGIEVSPKIAKLATQRMRNITVGNVETIDLTGIVQGQQYRTVVLGDVLEHLVDPWTLLRELTTNLDSEAEVLISLPNIRNLRVIFPLLLKGEFRYRQQGILDKTHLRFFTHSSMIEMIEDAGLSVESETCHLAGSVRYPGLAPLGRMLGALLVDQYVFRCVKV